mgnify:CR=1 FL=1
MGRRTVVAVVVAAVALLAAVVSRVRRNSVRFDRAVGRRVDELLARADTSAADTVTTDDFADLPPPVRQYFERVLPEERTDIQTARIQQAGALRLGDSESPWRPMEATQHVRTDPPGFLWDATVAVAPLVPAQVVDAYEDGTGSLEATLYSTVTVADAERGPALDEGELLRYLAEAVWYPTALLPRNGVEWEPIHDRAARATLSHRGTTATLTFYFGADGLVTRVVGDRPRRLDDGRYETTRWTGHWRDYAERDGVLIPTSGEVAWNLPGETRTYWRASLESIEYDVATPAGEPRLHSA